MHPRNLHKDGYPFKQLIASFPALSLFVKLNPKGQQTIDFANPDGVKTLNAALLRYYYNIGNWDIPSAYLCPPVPGRADYVHALADLLAQDSGISNQTITGLDIGTGASLIYPIIACRSYAWNMVASEIDAIAVKSAKLIKSSNPVLKKCINVRHQHQANKVFDGIIKPSDKFAFTMCNPPFHASAQEARKGTIQKNTNLRLNKSRRNPNPLKPTLDSTNEALNFAGKNHELWCEGGEVKFILKMISESAHYQSQVRWFTSLVSKKDNLAKLTQTLKKRKVAEHQVINMTQGNKISRFIAWRF